MGAQHRLIRLDRSGHTVVAEWTAQDEEAFALAAAAFRDELERGYLGVRMGPDGSAEQVTELPLDAATTILRLPIAGG